MIQELVVYHKSSPSGAERIPQGIGLWSFSTCLRQIHFAWAPENDDVPEAPDFNLKRGPEAYQFLLEILCGLHSPVVGETEVFGQFKNFWVEVSDNCPLQNVFTQILTDVKRVRQIYLKDFGSQSYGSLIRRYVKDYSSIAFVGAGQLVQEILPWVSKEKSSVKVYCRNPEKAFRDLKRWTQTVMVSPLETSIEAAVVVVCAPVTSHWLKQQVKSGAFVIDLRGEGRSDPCYGFESHLGLEEFFGEIEKNKSQVQSSKREAIAHIANVTVQRSMAESVRPFGWDDLASWS